MKEMIYGERMENPGVLYSGDYKGHKFAILNLGTHPTAYVEDKIGLMGYEDFRLKEISVHGGFTFHDTGYWGNESEKISWLGWDYAHCDDFMGYYSIDNPFYYQSKQWTTAEIYEDVKRIIEQIIEAEQYAETDEAKSIQAMLEDCRKAYYDYSQAEEICRTLYLKGYGRTEEQIKVNINNLIKVKITDYGEEHLIEKMGFRSFRDFEKSKKQADGYYILQFHEFMYYFGELLYVGNPHLPCEVNILYYYQED